jgi:CheY-like chemotaxis protein/anti-sigma regulatory factor (Ser/Thr protein kinase)
MTDILVVDDMAMDRHMVGEFLGKDESLRLDYAADGAEALGLLGDRVPDIIITDLVMPKVDGLELVATVRNKYPLIPVVLMTSKGSEETAVRALQEGAASYVPKRLLANDLLSTVKKILSLTVKERVKTRLMGCMARNQSAFVLGNDAALFAPLISYFQDGLFHMALCDEHDCTRVGVALEEALANALYHGNLQVDSELRGVDDEAYRELVHKRSTTSPYRERRIFVEAALSPTKAVFVIRDEGRGFDPEALPDPTDPANIEKASGRGILLMRTFMDDTMYNNVGNAVMLTRRRTSPQDVKR